MWWIIHHLFYSQYCLAFISVVVCHALFLVQRQRMPICRTTRNFSRYNTGNVDSSTDLLRYVDTPTVFRCVLAWLHLTSFLHYTTYTQTTPPPAASAVRAAEPAAHSIPHDCTASVPLGAYGASILTPMAVIAMRCASSVRQLLDQNAWDRLRLSLRLKLFDRAIVHFHVHSMQHWTPERTDRHRLVWRDI